MIPGETVRGCIDDLGEQRPDVFIGQRPVDPFVAELQAPPLFDGGIDLERLRAMWKPISPHWFLERVRDRQTLLVYARYDLTFPPDLSEDLVREFRARGVPHEVAVLRCGHYSTGKTPFKFLDGWILTRFLRRNLVIG